jgi:PPM family protein phosphatase
LDTFNAKALQASFKQANAKIYQAAQSQAELNGMGTTLVALVIHKGKMYYANVGDSRLYRIRNGRCEQLTEDHSLVANLLKGGLITDEEAASHPDKNVITRSIGTYPNVDVDYTNKLVNLRLGDRFLLCSDGLYDLVKPEEIIEIIPGNNPAEACQQLIKQANAQGGHDNITALIINVLIKLAPENKNPKKRYQ